MVSRRRLAESVVDRLLAGESQSVVLKQLAAYIITENLEKETDRLIADINRLLSSRGKLLAQVTTARALDADSKKLIKAYLAELNPATSSIEIEERIDPSLIGGMIIETPDKRLDTSVASRLKQLRSL